jgi:hypothetical protein
MFLKRVRAVDGWFTSLLQPEAGLEMKNIRKQQNANASLIPRPTTKIPMFIAKE